MSKYTAQQVRDWHTEAHLACLHREDYESAQEHGDMADAIAALLRERESAKAAVTDEIVYRACKAGRITRDEPPEHERAAMRRKLEAVAPMLASARVLELENALRMVVAANAMLSEIEGGKTLYEGSPTHSTLCLLAWSNLNTAIANAKQALAAAPKPEKE